MSLSVGIVGLPNVGKSTLFNALLRRQMASVSERPFTTIKPNVGVVKVPDERLQILAQALNIDNQIPTTVEFIDIAGLVKGAHQGEGLGNRFLAHIGQADAILHVLRGFVSKTVPHVAGRIDPVHDLTTVNLELILADFEKIAKSIDSLRPGSFEFEALEKAKQVLVAGELLVSADFSSEELIILGKYNFLTFKPTVYLLNLNDSGVAASRGLPDYQKDSSEALPEVLICSAQLESDIGELDESDQQKYLKELGLDQPVLDRIIRDCYRILGLITFFTVKGGQQVQARSLTKNQTALEAAGRVHTDFAQRFIKAEVINWRQLVKLGSWEKAKKAGKVELVGRDYQIKDGQVIEFKFGK